MKRIPLTLSEKIPVERIRETFRYFDYNPVWVKNLRQAGRSRIVPYYLILAMGVFFWFMFKTVDNEAARDLGQRVFTWTIFLLGMGSYFGIPLYFFSLNLSDRVTGNSHMAGITTMGAPMIMYGKVLTALTLIACLYSTALPFLVFCYFLRGIDVLTILHLPPQMILHTLVLTVCAISMGDSNFKTRSKIIFSDLFGIPMSFYCLATTMIVATIGMRVEGAVYIVFHYMVLGIIYTVGYLNGTSSAKELLRSQSHVHPIRYSPEPIRKQTPPRRSPAKKLPAHAKLPRKPRFVKKPPPAAVPPLKPIPKPKKLPEPKTKFQRFIRYHDINPVLVKDLRQAIRANGVTVSLQLMMAVFCLATILQSDEHLYGVQLFKWILGFLCFATFFVLPGYVCLKNHMEQQDGATDMMCITTLKSGRILIGKALGCAYLLVVVYSTAIPFFVVAYILDGTDLPTLVFLFPWMFFLNFLLLMAAIPIGLYKMPVLLKSILGILLVWFGGWYSMATFYENLGVWPGMFDSGIHITKLLELFITFGTFYTAVCIAGVVTIRRSHRRSILQKIGGIFQPKPEYHG